MWSRAVVLVASMVAVMSWRCACDEGGVKPHVEYAWKTIDLTWADAQAKGQAADSGLYMPENVVPIGFAVWADKVFVAMPRYREGVPVTLAYFTFGKDKSPRLTPYPTWDDNELLGESIPRDNRTRALTSVFRLDVDVCDRLWVFDSGEYNYTGGRVRTDNPSFLIYDLKTDTLIHRHYFKSESVEKSSFYGHMTVEVDAESCDDAFAYVADLGSAKVVVFSLKENVSWDVHHHFFNFDPLEGFFNISGVEFAWTDGVVAVAPGEKKPDGSKTVYFHSTASTKEFAVSDSVLKNETWAVSGDNFHDFKLVGDRGPGGRSTASIFDENSNLLIYSQIERNGLACWDTSKKMTPETSVLFVSDAVTMEFPCDLKIVNSSTLWVLTNKLSRFIYQSPLDEKQINFRLLAIPMRSIASACI